MARFRATISGNGKEVSRLGHARNGLSVRLDGWHIGVDVRIYDDGGKDRILISRTDGSGSSTKELLLDLEE